VTLVVLLALLGPAVAPAGAEDDTTAQEEYDEVIGEEAVTLDRLADARKAREGYEAEALVLEATLEETRAALADAEQRLRDAAAAVDRAEDELAQAERDVERSVDRLRRQAIDSYMFGDASGSQASLLSPVDEAGRVRTYADAVVDHQQRLVEELDEARIERDRLADEADAVMDEADRHRADIDAARLLVETQLAQKAELVRLAAEEEAAATLLLLDLQTRKVAIEARITQMQRDSDGLGLIIAQAQLGQPDWTPFSVVTVDPIPGAPMTSPFGIRFHPILLYERLHAGQDISAPSGTPIRAAADGTVLIASVRGGYGNTTVIDHGHSLSTLYGHQSQLLVAEGQQVKAGDVIGRVGSTGMSTGPHLHFETRVRGVPVDPTYFVARS
jgi:murein DD-endopeptidase MepM/ murein hydrolase activator NlpD